ncbi:MAG: tail fiber domain-containing protein, partial [Pantoea sp.]|nr:tail fiber domain-containing protein [Pantoea sp.]
MPAGTITVTNGSATVTGSGTSFTTELKAGDFIGINVGGTTYTLVVAA